MPYPRINVVPPETILAIPCVLGLIICSPSLFSPKPIECWIANCQRAKIDSKLENITKILINKVFIEVLLNK